MAKPVSSEERERIIAAFATGKSCRQIAREFGRSTGTISAIAADVGHEFGRSNVARAVEINRRYGAEWRAQARQKLADAFDELMADLKKPLLVYSFGGRDNTYNEHQLKKPDPTAKKHLIQAASTAMRTITEMDKAEQGGTDDPLLQWVAGLEELREARRKSDDDDPTPE